MKNNGNSIRGKLSLIALFYTAFIIYGSLVPLDYVPITFELAWQKFSNIQFLKLSIHSRADWVANGLLLIPFSFFWLGVFWVDNYKKNNFLSSLFVIIIVFTLSTSIEFIQIFFPTRTVSQNDIIAGSIGGVTGVITWTYLNQPFKNWFTNFLYLQSSSRWRIYLDLYIFAMFAYSVIPLDLTLSPVELFHKWEAGRLIFIPFMTSHGDPLIVFYNILTDVLIWTPVAVLWSLTMPLSYNRVIIKVVLTATVIEFCQLFVFSRYSDLTDIITAAMGAYVGVYIVNRFKLNSSYTASKQDRYNHYSSKWAIMGLSTSAIWLCILVIVYWYPFNFQIDKTLISDKINSYFSVPFASYYFGSEYLAITQVFRKFLFAMPLGISLALLSMSHTPLSFKPVLKVSYFFIIFGIFFGLELGQILVPDRTANFTDVILSSIGGLFGFFVFRNMLLQYFEKQNFKSKSISTESSEPQKDTGQNTTTENHLTITPINRDNSFFIIIGITILYLFLIVLAGVSEIPYNFKEVYANNIIWRIQL